jgi:hypothetical protein
MGLRQDSKAWLMAFAQLLSGSAPLRRLPIGVLPLFRSLRVNLGRCDRLSYCPVPFLGSMPSHTFRFSTQRYTLIPRD